MVILADSSAWVGYLRGTGSPAAGKVRELAGTGELASTEVIAMEVLAGARDAQHLGMIRSLLSWNESLPISPLEDYESAAAIYRTCRAAGVTPRQMNDCVIAAIAIRNDVALLRDDRDFESLARYTPLRTIMA